MAIPFDISTFPLGTAFIHTSGLKANLQRTPDDKYCLFDKSTNEFHIFLHNLTPDWCPTQPHTIATVPHPITGEECIRYVNVPDFRNKERLKPTAPITRPAQAESITAGMDIGKDEIHWEIQQSNRAAEENRKWQKELEGPQLKQEDVDKFEASYTNDPTEGPTPGYCQGHSLSSINRQLITKAEKDIFNILSQLYEETGLTTTSLECHTHGDPGSPRLHFVEIASLELGPEQ